MKNTKRQLVIMIITGFLLGACSSNTKLTSEWKNTGVSSAPLSKVAVIVIAKDESLRRYAEDEMVAKMPTGVTSVAGYTMFDKPEKNVSKVRELLIKNGFDGALVTRLVRIDEKEEYIPPQTIMQPMYPYNSNIDSFNGYYGNAYNSTYVTTTDGYTINTTNVIVETKLYRLPDGVLMWSGTTNTLNPNSKSEVADGIANIVEAEIKRDGLLSSK